MAGNSPGLRLLGLRLETVRDCGWEQSGIEASGIMAGRTEDGDSLRMRLGTVRD